VIAMWILASVSFIRRPNILGTRSRWRQKSEKRSPDHHEMKVTDDEVSVVDVDVDRSHGGKDAGEAPDDEHRNESRSAEHWGFEADGAPPHGPQPVEGLIAEGTAITTVDIMKAVPNVGFIPLVNIWWPRR